MPTLLPPTESEVCGTGATPNKGAAREVFRKWIKAYLNLFGTLGTTQGARAALGIKQLQALDATVAASALTVTLQPTNIDFRSTTLGSGAITNVDVPSAITLVIPSGATMGSTSAVKTRLDVIAINNAGTVELAAVNAAGGVVLNEEGVLTTTVLNTASDSNNVVYSTTARTNLAFHVVGHLEYTQAAAGTYVTAPSLIAGARRAVQPIVGTSGYKKTDDGLIIQWGSKAAGTAGNDSLNFPMAFPNGCLSATASFFDSSVPAGAILGIQVVSATASVITVNKQYVIAGPTFGNATQGWSYFAVGY